MRDASDVSTPQKVKRIGIILADMGKVNVSVLKFLILHMNTLQQTFEFEFLPTCKDEFLQKLSKQTKLSKVSSKGSSSLSHKGYGVTNWPFHTLKHGML